MSRLGVIGIEHIGSMLARRLVESGAVKQYEVIISNRNREKADVVAKEIGIRVGINRDVVEQSELIPLCVRPLEIRGVLIELKEILSPEKILVSVAMDVSIRQLQAVCDARIVRIIPSITLDCLNGISLAAFSDAITERDKSFLIHLFRFVGKIIEVEEKDFDILADLTSCAPAFISSFLQEMALAASLKGVPLEQAEWLIRQSLLCTAELLSRESFEDLISCVATKGGITEQGLNVIRKHSSNMYSQLFDATKGQHRQIKSLVEEQWLGKN
ncbi:MAG: NAD(P)-binding domain-containing protein [Methanotrichaceae archaeon]|nr:NAD(P)-binding domain-containing protein [Methanotrichaceae archaeon]